MKATQRNVTALLWNSTDGKIYCQSDGFLENGIGLLEAACRQEGIEIIVEDPANIGTMMRFAEEDVPGQMRKYGISARDLRRRLGELAPDVFIPIIPEEQRARQVSEWKQLQEISSRLTEEKMGLYLDSLVKKAIEQEVDIVGIKAWFGRKFHYSEELARMIAQRSSGIITIAGGAQVNQYGAAAMIGNHFDLAIRHEGENTLVRVANIVGELMPIRRNKEHVLAAIAHEARNGRLPNLIYRDGGQVKESSTNLIKITDKPSPIYGDKPGKVMIGIVHDGLACYYREGCNFCVHNISLGGKYRVQPVEDVIEEIKKLIKQDIGILRFSSSALPAKRGEKIARRILEEKVNVEYSVFTRAENNAERRSNDLVLSYEAMIRSGLRAIFLGGECADQEVLDHSFNKGNSVSDIYYTIVALNRASKNTGIPIDIGISFIYPVPILVPGITQESVLKKDLALVDRLLGEGVNISSVLVTPPCPIPGSRWCEESEKYGFSLPPDFVDQWMRYNFELGKPPSEWPDIAIGLGDMRSWKEIQEYTGKIVAELRNRDIPLNLTDEHCVAARAAGIKGVWGLSEFKTLSDLAIASGDYRYLEEVYRLINEHSIMLARSNRFHPNYEPMAKRSLVLSHSPLERVLEPEAMSDEDEVIAFQNMASNATHLEIIDYPFVKEALNLGVRNGKVLDAACGGGIISRRIAEMGRGAYQVWGVDLSQGMIDVAEDNREGLPLVYMVGDISQMPFEDGFFDLVVCNHLFHHIHDEQKMLKILAELDRVLSKDGAMLIKDICRPETEAKLAEYKARFGIVYPLGLQRDIYINSIKAGLSFPEWRNIFVRSGLMKGIGVELKEVFNLGCPTHLVYSRRKLG